MLAVLKDAILKEGRVINKDILKVDSFLNHQIDIGLFQEIGKEFFRLFQKENITKILTIEASGIGIACITAQYFNVPVLFAKKQSVKTQGDNVYTAAVHSFTHGKDYVIRICRDYLTAKDRVLIIDDFLANGEAIRGLMSLASQASAYVAGAGVVIEKGFQEGGAALRKEGLNLQSLAIVESMDDNGNIIIR